ncbi:hypothetical protein B0A49_03495 [Cryomyces minteri]|uniref:AMP-activated protein kinase glycogen-binding domain-containing protein n=1 Tax=Cryomyces minteri TaxID=331657 RepID=A0A4U0XPP4_9PEZI|nr:hypothetical protein B0A49_03495 [Cryomyces minteri]
MPHIHRSGRHMLDKIKQTAKESTDAMSSAASLPVKGVQTLISPHAKRPQAHTRPSWIGPAPIKMSSDFPGQTVKITYAHPGTKPPVYIITSLGSPQWEPTEMQYSPKDGELEFSKSFENVDEGEYQYKFRLGPGDWWVLDETAETVTDNAGNRNNLIVVKPASDTPSKKHTPPVGNSQPLHTAEDIEPHDQDQATTVKERQTSEDKSHDLMTATEVDNAADEESAPLLRHETMFEDKPQHIEDPDDEPYSEEEDDEEPAPLFRHETMFPTADLEEKPSNKSIVLDEVEEEDSAASRAEHVPLFSHETFHENLERAPTEPSESPARKSAKFSLRHFEESDYFNDPSLEEFPTDHNGILQQLQRTSTHLNEDDTFPDGTPPSPVQREGSVSPILSRSISHTSQMSLHSPLNPIAEVEDEPNDESKASVLELPAAQMNTEAPPSETTIDHGIETVANVPDLRSPATDTSLLTPPMTPKEATLSGPDDTPSARAAQSPAEEVSDPTPLSTQPTLYETSTDGPRQRKSSPKPDSNGQVVAPNSLGAPSERQKRGVLDSFWRVLFGGWLAPFGRWFAALFGKERRAT